MPEKEKLTNRQAHIQTIHKQLCIMCLAFLCVWPVEAQNAATPTDEKDAQHFAKQLLKLEEELIVFRDKIDEKEQQMRMILSKKNSKLYTLKQQQRDAEDLSNEERQKLADHIKTLAQSIAQDKEHMQEAMSMMERKRKDIFSLKLSIDEWVAKVEATEVAVISQIQRMKREITALIEDLDKKFHINEPPKKK